ncbi:MAG: NUDIX hydrolase [Desulfobacteraceae bacterium]|nr:MAG: NUDIX hydrolase [Desulfobacteraceae bacterium]
MNIHSNSEKTTLKDAATVILVKEEEEKPFEVFLMQRHKKQSFMGGAFVFPGGALDPADCDNALMQYMTGVSIKDAINRLNEYETPWNKAMGLYFTAIRETFEESGILLAELDVDTSRNFAGRFNSYREEIHDGVLTLKDLAVKENIRYALNLLMPYARWITPEFETKRFDTRFFLARKPKHQNAEHDRKELVGSLWATPEKALEKNFNQEIMLMPPTLKIIEELTAYSSIDDLFSFASGKKVEPILPQLFQNETAFGIMLPHDPEYTINAYKKPPRENEPSRVLMVDGRFKTMFAF